MKTVLRGDLIDNSFNTIELSWNTVPVQPSGVGIIIFCIKGCTVCGVISQQSMNQVHVLASEKRDVVLVGIELIWVICNHGL